MPRLTQGIRLLIATAAALGSAAAIAWTPYDGGPYGSNTQTAGQAGGAQVPATPDSSVGANMPEGFQPLPGAAPYAAFPGTPPLPYGYGQQAPGYSPPRSGPGFRGMGPRSGYGGTAGSLQLSRHTTEDAYVIEIQLNDMKPEDIQVSTRGNWISVSRDQSREETREEYSEQGPGFSRSYSFSSGHTSRRFNVPRDADLSAISREEREGVLRISIPRHHQ